MEYLTTEQFKDKVSGLGYELHSCPKTNMITIYTNELDNEFEMEYIRVIAEVKTDVYNQANTDLDPFYVMNHLDRSQLISAIESYIKTPLEER